LRLIAAVVSARPTSPKYKGGMKSHISGGLIGIMFMLLVEGLVWILFQ